MGIHRMRCCGTNRITHKKQAANVVIVIYGCGITCATPTMYFTWSSVLDIYGLVTHVQWFSRKNKLTSVRIMRGKCKGLVTTRNVAHSCICTG